MVACASKSFWGRECYHPCFLCGGWSQQLSLPLQEVHGMRLGRYIKRKLLACWSGGSGNARCAWFGHALIVCSAWAQGARRDD